MGAQEGRDGALGSVAWYPGSEGSCGMLWKALLGDEKDDGDHCGTVAALKAESGAGVLGANAEASEEKPVSAGGAKASDFDGGGESGSNGGAPKAESSLLLSWCCPKTLSPKALPKNPPDVLPELVAWSDPDRPLGAEGFQGEAVEDEPSLKSMFVVTSEARSWEFVAWDLGRPKICSKVGTPMICAAVGGRRDAVGSVKSSRSLRR